MKIPVIKREGWEVRPIRERDYKPDPEWYPFAVTGVGILSSIVWVRQEKVTYTKVDVDDND